MHYRHTGAIILANKIDAVFQHNLAMNPPSTSPPSQSQASLGVTSHASPSGAGEDAMMSEVGDAEDDEDGEMRAGMSGLGMLGDGGAEEEDAGDEFDAAEWAS